MTSSMSFQIEHPIFFPVLGSTLINIWKNLLNKYTFKERIGILIMYGYGANSLTKHVCKLWHDKYTDRRILNPL